MIEKGTVVELFFKIGGLKVKGTVISFTKDVVHLLHEDDGTQSIIYNPIENLLLIKIPPCLVNDEEEETEEAPLPIAEKVREKATVAVNEYLNHKREEKKQVSKFLQSPPRDLTKELENRYELPSFLKKGT